MTNHPNRSSAPSPGRNPSPQEIRALREARGETQDQAAKSILSTERTWQGWEQGLRRMHPALWWLYRHGGLTDI